MPALNEQVLFCMNKKSLLNFKVVLNTNLLCYFLWAGPSGKQILNMSVLGVQFPSGPPA